MDKALAIQKQVQEILGTDQVFLVGGSVRDLEMGNTAKDYDFCTPMLPEEMIEKVKAAGRRVYTIGEKFGTIGFKVPYIEVGWVIDEDMTEHEYSLEKFEYVEVTTFRSEVYTNKSRKPEVKFVPSLDEDLARRDFTMNAMVLRSDGTIYDPYGGRLHIHAKKIITVGMPKDRINEDPLRMLRAARFAARYNFTIDPNFIGKARQLADRIYDVSTERWVQEMDKMLTVQNRHMGFLFMKEMNLLVRVLPELDAVLNIYPESEGIEFFTKDKEYTVDEAWRGILGWSGLPFSINGNESTNKLTKYINSGICARLKFSNDRTDIILDKKK